MSYDRQDTATSQALMQMSSWSDAYLQQPNKPFFPGRLTAMSEAGLLKALLTDGGSKDKRKSRQGAAPLLHYKYHLGPLHSPKNSFLGF